MKQIYFSILSVFLLVACQKAGPKVQPGASPNFGNYPQTSMTIKEEGQLIGGPSAQGRVGDVLLENDLIRVIIQKPSVNAGIGTFGGTIIDADRVRSAGELGNDHFGELFPLVNVEWTVNYYDYQVVLDGDAKVLRAQGIIDTYDYLDIDFITEVATTFTGQPLYFDDQFDDRRDPFNLEPNVRNVDPQVVTEYRLEPGKPYVRIDTTFTNLGSTPAKMPVGDFIVAGGALGLLIPGQGYSPSLMTQVDADTPGVLLVGLPGVDVSYGYFYDFSQFLMPAEGDAPAQKYKTSSISYSGLTGVTLGEGFLKILPLGSGSSPEIHFEIPPESSRTITRYFVVGDGTASSLLDVGLEILKIPSVKVSGTVVDAAGNGVKEATVAVKRPNGPTFVTFKSDAQGKFSGNVATGKGEFGSVFGDGKYEFVVEKRGHHKNETNKAGECTPRDADLSTSGDLTIRCVLGEAGRVRISGVIDVDTEGFIPSRLIIVGEDPSPESEGAGTFEDTQITNRPFGVVDVKFLNAKGTLGLTDEKEFQLEPETYLFSFSHGPEYSVVEKIVEVSAGQTVTIEPIRLKHVVPTPGYISADFHVHALPSPDSAMSVERRALEAVAAGLDVLQSSDHDFLTDYGPVVTKLESMGVLSKDSIQTMVGDEITPNHYGHLHAFPLTPDFSDVNHGALNWSAHPADEISPLPDMSLSPQEIVNEVRKDPGEEVIQINHIADNPTGLLVAAGWLTTPMYEETFGTPAMSSFADPVERRLNAGTRSAPPFGLGETSLLFEDFTAVELTIGGHLNGDTFLQSALPTWFNLLNLGYRVTATGSSDSHEEIPTPLGFPRNYIVSSMDPRDGLGDSFAAIDEEEYANNINQQKSFVTTGPIVSVEIKNAAGEKGSYGDTLSGTQMELDVKIVAPEWAWFDTVEMYANTKPIPSDDSGKLALRGEAENPNEFAAPYHVPHYMYEPNETWRLKDKDLPNWKKEKGVISARFTATLQVQEDTWVVFMVKGTRETEGYRSLFPVVPNVLKDSAKTPKNFNVNDLSSFHKDPLVSTPAWALTNPVFIDVDGDGFQGIWEK